MGATFPLPDPDSAGVSRYCAPQGGTTMKTIITMFPVILIGIIFTADSASAQEMKEKTVKGQIFGVWRSGDEGKDGQRTDIRSLGGCFSSERSRRQNDRAVWCLRGAPPGAWPARATNSLQPPRRTIGQPALVPRLDLQSIKPLLDLVELIAATR